jgi:hypothetical protein
MENRTTAFKPSFPNPDVWTDELIRKRQDEFAQYRLTPQGIAEDKAFDEAYSQFETLRENGEATGAGATDAQTA